MGHQSSFAWAFIIPLMRVVSSLPSSLILGRGSDPCDAHGGLTGVYWGAQSARMPPEADLAGGGCRSHSRGGSAVPTLGRGGAAAPLALAPPAFALRVALPVLRVAPSRAR